MTATDDSRIEYTNGPLTERDCKKVMLRAERGDTIDVEGLGEAEVIQRQHTYYGPSLLLYADDENWRLSCPGPTSQLQLWEAVYLNEQDRQDGMRAGWRQHSEVTAEIVDTEPYDICQQCGNPIRSMQHERQAAMNMCAYGGDDD